MNMANMGGYFNDQRPFFLVFKGWVPTTNSQYIGAWIAVFVLGLAYELIQPRSAPHHRAAPPSPAPPCLWSGPQCLHRGALSPSGSTLGMPLMPARYPPRSPSPLPRCPSCTAADDASFCMPPPPWSLPLAPCLLQVNSPSAPPVPTNSHAPLTSAWDAEPLPAAAAAAAAAVTSNTSWSDLPGDFLERKDHFSDTIPSADLSLHRHLDVDHRPAATETPAPHNSVTPAAASGCPCCKPKVSDFQVINTPTTLGTPPQATSSQQSLTRPTASDTPTLTGATGLDSPDTPLSRITFTSLPLAEPATSGLPRTSPFLPDETDITSHSPVNTDLDIPPNPPTDQLVTRHGAPSRRLTSRHPHDTQLGTMLGLSTLRSPKGLTRALSRFLSSDDTMLRPLASSSIPELCGRVSRNGLIRAAYRLLSSDTTHNTQASSTLDLCSPQSPLPRLTAASPRLSSFPTPRLPSSDALFHARGGAVIPTHISELTCLSLVPFPTLTTPAPDTQDPFVAMGNGLTLPVPESALPATPTPSQTRSSVTGAMPIAHRSATAADPFLEQAYQTLGAAVSSVPPRCDGSPGLLPSTRETIIQGCHLTQEQLSAESRHQLGVGAFGSVFRATLANKPELGEVAVKETTRLTQQWEDDSSVPPHALALLVAGREITVATAFLGYLVDIAHQLTCLHTLGIVHSDVKLDNIVVLHGRAFLIDLGLSVRRPHGSLYSDAYRGGTAVFRAPECMSGLFSEEAGRASETLDVYATGLLVLYALALGWQRPGPAGVAVAFEGMHTALLSAGADLSVQAMAILEQAEIAESVASRCRRQLSSLTEFATSRTALSTVVLDTTEQQLLLSQIDLQALWLVWEEAGCAAELVTFIVGIATFSLPALDAVARVHEVTVVEQWVSRVMAEYKQLLLDMGCPMSLKEAWDSGPALPDLYLSRTALYPW
ncbi:MAG: hypothetical protein WDW36_009782 [Sanguina aurantia]